MSDAAPQKAKHPPGLYILFGTEAAERFSFYTMRALLVLYLTNVIYRDLAADGQIIRDKAGAVYGTYLLLVYLSGLLGGYFADKILGARKAIFLGGIVMCAGLFVMASADLLFYGLALIIAGNGFFKPNISTIVSGLYPEGDKRRDPAFTIFYMGINLGAFFAIFGAGVAESLGKDYEWGWNVGFVVAGVGMIFSLWLFWWGQKLLGTAGFPPHREVTPESRLNARDWRDILVWAAVVAVSACLFVFSWDIALEPLWSSIPSLVKIVLGVALSSFAIGGFVFTNRDNNREEWERIISITVLSVFVIFFWAGFEQAGFTLNLFALEQTDRNVSADFTYVLLGLYLVGLVATATYLFGQYKKSGSTHEMVALVPIYNAIPLWHMGRKTSFCLLAGGQFLVGALVIFLHYNWLTPWEMPATWFQGFNPLFIILLAPIFSLIWAWNDRRENGLSTPGKMGIGMIILGFGFVVMYFGQGMADTYGRAALGWLVAVYLLHTIGELCLSPIGLSMVTKLSPVRRVSLMMGVWFFCTAIADYLSGRLEAVCRYFGIGLWSTLIATSIGAGLVLLMVTPLLKKWMHGRD